MKYIKYILLFSSLLLLTLSLTSCVTEQNKQSKATTQEALRPLDKPPAPQPNVLPVTYQTASYVIDKQAEEDAELEKEATLKVGARITSTRGPQPLWDIVKRLAALKGMNVSWASDVDKNALVDVDINADDDFYQALDNMLRQVDYFHEMHNNTIVVKYRETRQFQIAMPFMKQALTTGTGGNVLGSSGGTNNVDGTIKLNSDDNTFDIWDNIKLNLDTLLEVWSFRREAAMVQEGAEKTGEEDAARSFSGSSVADTTAESEDTEADTVSARSEGGVSGGKGYYMIDKPVGIITVTAPRPILEKIDKYITSLKKRLYQQISIEAKIIEVQLRDASSIGINWSGVLKDFGLTGRVTFGANGQVYPFIYSNDEVVGDVTYTDETRSAYFKSINPGQFISNVSLDSKAFGVFLNALNEQGDTKILSNPKLSVMNGQPALITVGRNVTYIDKIESDRDTDTGTITFTVETERILSGLGMALTATVLGSDEIIMNLVPITSELQEPIFYQDVGNDGAIIGLPVVNVREINTTVKIRNGEMLVIGGLITDVEQNTGEFAPLVGNIPLIKYLFGFEEKENLKRELIILLRPRLI